MFQNSHVVDLISVCACRVYIYELLSFPALNLLLPGSTLECAWTEHSGEADLQTPLRDFAD
jgi:hypothetical protein